MSRRFVLASSALIVSVLSACQPNVGDAVEGSISGTVVKGPVSAATVTAFSVTKEGRREKELGSTTSADDGTFTLPIGGHFGPTLVCAKAGTFTEEATGGLISQGPNELCALVDDQKLAEATTGVKVTPLTTLGASLTGCLVQRGAERGIAEAGARATSRLNAFFAAGTAGFDLRATPVFDPTAAVAPSLAADVWHGLLLAGLSESARQISLASDLDPGVRVTSATLATELVRDIDDGRCVFDGKGPSQNQLVQGSVALSSNTLRGAPQGLALSIERFLDGSQNKSGIGVLAVKDLTRALTTHESDIFLDDASVAPPVVSIAEPVAGPVSGKPVVRVLADDAVGVADVAFVAPAPLVGTGETTCSSNVHCELVGELNTALFAPGLLTITARATNAAGVSSDVSVSVVVNNELPEINVTAPNPGTVAGTIPILATTTSAVGVAAFDLDIPGSAILPTCTAPATTNCDREPDPTIIDVLWDTTTAPEGALELTFRATDTAGNAAFRVVSVDVDNIPVGTIAGTVELGFPLAAANVSAFEMTNGVRGALIGTATTDDEGRYQIENPTSVGVVEVVASGGSFQDTATGQVLTLRAGQELSTALADVAPGANVVANVNAWTTLAKKRAVGTQADSPSFAAAVTFNANLFASHLLRPGSLSLTGSASANLLEDDPAPSDSAAILALAHAGLSRVAAQTSIDVGGAPGQITPADLLDVLLADLNDGVLDGTDNGVALFLDQQSVPADSKVLRTSLAIGIDNFVKNAPFRDNGVVVLDAVRNASSIASDALVAPGLLYDDLSLDRSILFPANEPVSAFDTTPPTIELAFAAPNDGAAFGDALDGVVAIIGAANDASGLSAFDVLSPDVADLFSPVADVRVEIDGSHAPNSSEVLSRCGVSLGDPPFNINDASREVCLCMEAVDTLENTAHGVRCFTRPRPRVATDATAFVGPARAGVTVNATGSFDLVSCSATIAQGAASVGTASAEATGASCALLVPFAAPLQPGTAVLDVDVTEIGGAVSRSSFTYTVDLDAPTLAVTAPAAGSFRTTPPLITATASDANLVSVVADITSNALPVVTGLVGTIGAGNTVAFPPFADTLADGLRTIIVTATDAAGNTSTSQRSYTKDTTAPALANLAAADGNPLASFQLTATTAFTPSSQCSTFPFTGCAFNISSSTATQVVHFRPSASGVETYRRWQHLAGTLVNPSTLSSPPVENRAPTLRLKTEAGVAVEARIDATCPADQAAFENRGRGTFTANAVGLVDVPIVDGQNLTTSPALLRSQTGAATLCLSMRPTDQAGNEGAIVTHFFKYEATPAPLFMVWNAGAYNPAAFQEDVKAFDDGHDNSVLAGSGQGAAGRVVAHAYLVSPSTSTSYNYSYSLPSGPAPSITVSHREVAQISKQRAFNWCYTLDGSDSDSVIDDDDDDLVNPDDIVANEANSPPNNPTWSGSNLDKVSSSASWALFSPTGGALLSANAVMEHHAVISGEQDTTFSHGPAASYSTSADTTELGQTFTFTIPLNTVTLEAWTFNTVTGLPGSLIDAGASVGFTAGGSSAASRHLLLLFRAPVPQNSLTLKSALTLNGQAGSIGFNDSCSARNSSGTAIAQMFTLPNDHWVIADASLSSGAEPAPPRRLLWVKSGSFTECKGTSTNDCRYGRYFDDYLGSVIAFPSGRSVSAQGQINGVSGASFVAQPAIPIPQGQTRELEQEQ